MKASISKVNTANRCLKKYAYRYIEELERITKDAKPQLGVIGHSSLENHLKGGDWTAPIAEFETKLRGMMAEEQELYAHIPSELYRMVRGYLNHWKKVDADVETLAVELPFEVDTPGGHTYEGIIDWIFRDKDGVWVCDHKFMKQIPGEEMRYVDAQTNMYFLVAQALGYEPTGVVFDYIRTKPPTTPKILKNGTVSKAACDTTAEIYLQTIKSAGQDPKDYMDKLEELSHNVFYKRTKVPRPVKLSKNVLQEFDDTCGLLDVLKAGDNTIMPRTITRDCSWDCEFSELCFTELSGTNSDYIREANYKHREKREDKENGDKETSE